jgi:hypothetical protein
MCWYWLVGRARFEYGGKIGSQAWSRVKADKTACAVREYVGDDPGRVGRHEFVACGSYGRRACCCGSGFGEEQGEGQGSLNGGDVFPDPAAGAVTEGQTVVQAVFDHFPRWNQYNSG